MEAAARTRGEGICWIDFCLETGLSLNQVGAPSVSELISITPSGKTNASSFLGDFKLKRDPTLAFHDTNLLRDREGLNSRNP
jgi:hypothetical protein